jgi:hypothetical protein
VESATQELSDADIDDLLAALAGTAGELIIETEAADRALVEWQDRGERYLEQRSAGAPWRLDPAEAVASVREELAYASAMELRRVSREWVAWWAYAATCAVLAASAGVPVTEARMVAVAPCPSLAGHGASCLPEPPEDIVQLVELSACTASAPSPGGGPDGPDMLRRAQDLAARYGLRLDRSAEGEWAVERDLTVESHRNSLWGAAWADYQLPLVPDVDQLTTLLTQRDVPPPVVAEVRGAVVAVDELLDAASRLSELPSLDEQFEEEEPPELPLSDEEIETLYTRLDPATSVLADYAATLTRHLPAIRTAARA